MLGKEIVDQFENHAGGHRAHYWDARTTIIDPERSSADAVHELRRSMKQWAGQTAGPAMSAMPR